jgi:branched-subunit amino acid transport protein
MDIFTVIILMGVVTYIPRLVPMYFINVEKIPSALKSFLSFVPYAALGALIFPGSINAINGKPVISIISIFTAVIIAWFNSNIIITVFLTVTVTYLLLLAGF